MTALKYLDTSTLMRSQMHGRHNKSLIVWHETVSPDMPGVQDILAVEHYLDHVGYGIHGMTDADGNLAWTYGLGTAVFWHAGGVNDIAIGIENVSMSNTGKTNAQTRAYWSKRTTQLDALAKLTATVAQIHGIPLKYVEGDGKHKGVTTHYSVSKYFQASHGHQDCWPVNDGGWFPTSGILGQARIYADEGWTLR